MATGLRHHGEICSVCGAASSGILAALVLNRPFFCPERLSERCGWYLIRICFIRVPAQFLIERTAILALNPIRLNSQLPMGERGGRLYEVVEENIDLYLTMTLLGGQLTCSALTPH